MNINVKEIFKEYSQMLFGILAYCIGYTVFMLPYKITTGGISGVATLIYYATGFQANLSYLIINAGLMCIGLYVMGWKYCLKTMISIGIITVAIGVLQDMLTITGPDGTETLYQIVGSDQMFMACIIGSLLEGLGLAFVFVAGGSTGGTDIIASCINKYRNISLGRLMICIDICIVGSSYFLFHDLGTMVVGYLALLLSLNFMDSVINGARQSVQFTIISNHYDEIAQRVSSEIERGVTVLNGQGWYSKEKRQVLLIMARKSESRYIFQLIRQVDPKAFVTMSNVEGVFGEGFDVIKK